MKIFKLIRTVFADILYWIRYSGVVMTAVGAAAFFGVNVVITLILGFVVNLLGISCGDATNIMAKGLIAYTVIIWGAGGCLCLWIIFKAIIAVPVFLFKYIKRTWKELE